MDFSKCKLETVQNEIDLLSKSDNQFIIKYADLYPVDEYIFCDRIWRKRWIEFGSDYTCPVAFMVFFNKKLKSEIVSKGTDKIFNYFSLIDDNLKSFK